MKRLQVLEEDRRSISEWFVNWARLVAAVDFKLVRELFTEDAIGAIARGKQVIIVAARGGVYAGNPALDFQVPYLKSVLGFLGMTDVEVLEVEGTAYGLEAAENAVTAATAKLHATCEQRTAAQAA